MFANTKFSTTGNGLHTNDAVRRLFFVSYAIFGQVCFVFSLSLARHVQKVSLEFCKMAPLATQ